MAEELFAVTLGTAIEDEVTGLNVYEEFTVAGVPGSAGLAAEELTLCDNAPVGSKCTDNSSAQGFSYRKKAVGGGELTWVREATVDDITNATSSDSWRDPADVKDNSSYANLAAAETAVNTGSIDGVTVADGDRVLFTNITGENKNVFIVTGTPGSGATLVEDTNTPTNNDVLLVNLGTDAGKEFHYNSVSTSWVESGQNGTNEDGFQNTYTGKPGLGNQTTSYTSQVKITNGDNLTVAVGKLDAAVDANETAIGNLSSAQGTLQTEVDNIEASLGSMVDANGNYVAHAGTNYIDGNADVSEDLTNLDTQVKANADAISNIGGGTVTAGITAVTTVDSVLVDDVKMVRWMVHVQQGTKVKTFEVDATHDGTAGADAMVADFAKYARLRINGNIAGLRVKVNVSGVGVAQAMNLTVQANSAVTVSTTRQQVL